mgnify:CR=1 FL=1
MIVYLIWLSLASAVVGFIVGRYVGRREVLTQRNPWDV